jgi:hypothetical protein
VGSARAAKWRPRVGWASHEQSIDVAEGITVLLRLGPEARLLCLCVLEFPCDLCMCKVVGGGSQHVQYLSSAGYKFWMFRPTDKSRIRGLEPCHYRHGSGTAKGCKPNLEKSMGVGR